MTDKKELSFETALSELESIVEKLEAPDVPLEKAIDYYQAGMKLSKLCDEKLTNAKEKMTVILTEEDQVEPFINEED